MPFDCIVEILIQIEFFCFCWSTSSNLLLHLGLPVYWMWIMRNGPNILISGLYCIVWQYCVKQYCRGIPQFEFFWLLTHKCVFYLCSLVTFFLDAVYTVLLILISCDWCCFSTVVMTLVALLLLAGPILHLRTAYCYNIANIFVWIQ